MRIIAIDPGYDRLGIAIIEKDHLVHSECFATSSKTEIYERLQQVGRQIKHMIETFSPNALAMETLFITKNQKTAMHVSEARGIIAYEAKLHGLPIFEYSPPQIKMAVTGDGRSDKGQIIKMIPLLIKMDSKKRLDDEYDAIAVGLTCLAHELKNF